MAKEKILTPEEKERKDRLKFRLFIILIVFDILLAGYLVYEMVSVFTGNNRNNSSTTIASIREIFEFIKLLR